MAPRPMFLTDVSVEALVPWSVCEPLDVQLEKLEFLAVCAITRISVASTRNYITVRPCIA
jgi:hypothetical protein